MRPGKPQADFETSMPRWCMPRRRPATITQADVRRIIRGAQQAGAKSVEIRIGEKASVVVRTRRFVHS